MDLLYGLLITLVLGSYGFTWAVYKILDKKFDEVIKNHLQHVTEDIDALEDKVDSHKKEYDDRKHFPQ